MLHRVTRYSPKVQLNLLLLVSSIFNFLLSNYDTIMFNSSS